MTTVAYRWKPAAHVSIDAQAAGEELEQIKVAHNGRLDAGTVVEKARSRRSVLHEHFEWDDAIAAGKFRVEQASYLIRMIELSPMPEAPEAPPVRAFVSVRQEEEQFYVSTRDALSDPELRQQVLDQAWRELEAWRQRHAELVEFAKIFAQIDKARLRS